jgi:hypothetical protein
MTPPAEIRERGESGSLQPDNPPEQLPGQTRTPRELAETGNTALKHFILYCAFLVVLVTLAWMYLRTADGFFGWIFPGVIIAALPLIWFDDTYQETVILLKGGDNRKNFTVLEKAFYLRNPLLRAFVLIFFGLSMVSWPVLVYFTYRTYQSGSYPWSYPMNPPFFYVVPVLLLTALGITYSLFRLKE